jgi:hypothetical protein
MKAASPDAEYARGRIVYLLLPAYNEEEGLEKLLGRLKRIATAYRLELRVLIVDDGSADHTQVVIRSSWTFCLSRWGRLTPTG